MRSDAVKNTLDTDVLTDVGSMDAWARADEMMCWLLPRGLGSSASAWKSQAGWLRTRQATRLGRASGGALVSVIPGIGSAMRHASPNQLDVVSDNGTNRVAVEGPVAVQWMNTQLVLDVDENAVEGTRIDA
jgi:hypothetical protein